MAALAAILVTMCFTEAFAVAVYAGVPFVLLLLACYLLTARRAR
jgi:L-asparagine transporter-like permease